MSGGGVGGCWTLSRGDMARFRDSLGEFDTVGETILGPNVSLRASFLLDPVVISLLSDAKAALPVRSELNLASSGAFTPLSVRRRG